MLGGARSQAELASGVEHVKAEGFSLEDTIERLKRVVGLVDKMVVSPLIATVTPGEHECCATGEESNGCAAEPQSEDEPMHDAQVNGTGGGGRKDVLAAAVASTVAVAVAAAVASTDI